jgi:hypothetical protein
MYTDELLNLLWVGALAAEVHGLPLIQGELEAVAESMVRREFWRHTVVKPRRVRLPE